MKKPAYLIYTMIIFAVIGIFTSCEHKRKLTTKDLKFPDPEKQGIVSNDIAYSIGIDTGCWKNEPLKIPLDSLVAEMMKDSMPIIGATFIAYNKTGNVTYQRPSACDFICQAFSGNTHFFYDSLGLPLYGRDGTKIDSPLYIFLPYSLKLVVYHKKNVGSNVFESSKDYIFDTAGLLLREIGFDTTVYTYDTKERLMAKTIYPKPGYGYVITERYFYGSNGLDSSIWSRNKTVLKSYYDKSGLLVRTEKTEDINDSSTPYGWLNPKRTRIYFHIKRK